MKNSLINRDRCITIGGLGSLEDLNPHKPGFHDPPGSLVGLTKYPAHSFFCKWNIIGRVGSKAPGPHHLVPHALPVRGLDQGLINETSDKVLTIPQNRGVRTL